MRSLFDRLDDRSVRLLRKDDETAAYRVPDSVSGRGDLFVKVYRLRSLEHRIKSLLRFRKSGWRDLAVNVRLKEMGVRVPEPAGACNDFPLSGGAWRSLFANRWLDEAVSVRDAVLSRHGSRSAGGGAADLELPPLCRGIGRFLRGLHDGGVVSTDMNAGNILLRKAADRDFELFLVDYERIRFVRRVDLDRRLANLAQVGAFLVEADPGAARELAEGYGMPEPGFVDRLESRTVEQNQRWKRREDENFAAVYRKLQKRV